MKFFWNFDEIQRRRSAVDSSGWAARSVRNLNHVSSYTDVPSRVPLLRPRVGQPEELSQNPEQQQGEPGSRAEETEILKRFWSNEILVWDKNCRSGLWTTGELWFAYHEALTVGRQFWNRNDQHVVQRLQTAEKESRDTQGVKNCQKFDCKEASDWM